MTYGMNEILVVEDRMADTLTSLYRMRVPSLRFTPIDNVDGAVDCIRMRSGSILGVITDIRLSDKQGRWNGVKFVTDACQQNNIPCMLITANISEKDLQLQEETGVQIFTSDKKGKDPTGKEIILPGMKTEALDPLFGLILIGNYSEERKNTVRKILVPLRK